MPHTFIIAEAGVNHNGSLDNALQLVDEAANAGADAIKFQTFDATKLASRHAEKAAYQKQFTDASESQLRMLLRLQLEDSDYIALAERCRERGIEFMSSPFDLDAVDVLVRCGVRQIKIPSGEITNGPMLLKIAASKLPCILSTGMSTLGDVETALAILAYGYLHGDEVTADNSEFFKQLRREDFAVLQEKVILLHCTSVYPAPYEDINLQCMETLKTAFGLRVGFSDHSMGVELPIAAVALRADAIEKHFTLSRDQEGPDHQASLEPDELRAMIAMIRNVEVALGSSFKYPTDKEFNTRAVARKGLVAGRDISQGEKFHPDNVAIKRPEAGPSPLMYWKLMGKPASKSYSEDESLVQD